MYSLKFAGFNVGYDYVIPNLSPLIPFLNSLVFRLGFISEDSIIIITGLFYIIGVISSYFLFKLRFNNLISTLGAFLFGNFFIILFSIGNGNLDIPSISLCILAMYLIFSQEYNNNNTINNNSNNNSNSNNSNSNNSNSNNNNSNNNSNNSNNNNNNNNNNFNNTNKNNSNNKNNQKNSYIQTIKTNKRFYLGFIILALGFLAKFTALLLLMVVLIYFLSKRDFKKNFKKYIQMLFLGFLLFALTIIPYVIYLALNYDNPLAFLSYADAMGLAEIKPEFFYQVFFYFERIPHIIYSPNLTFAYVLIALVLVGIIITGVKFIFYLKNKNKAIHRNNINNSKYKINNKYNDTNSKCKINNNKYNDTNSNRKINNNKYSDINSKYNIKNIVKIKSEKSYELLLILSIIILTFSFFLTYIATWKFTEILVFLGILIFVHGFNHVKSKNKSFNFDLTIFSWFFIYLIFFTTRITKGDRYFISFMPPFVFICLYFIDTFSKELNGLKAKLLKNIYVDNPKNYLKIKKLIKHEMLIKWLNFRKIIPIFIIILFLFSTTSYLSINRHESIINNEKEAVIWLKNYDTDYMNKVIVSDSPFYTFYMRKEVSLLTKNVNTSNIGSFLKNKSVSYFISNLNYSNHVKGYKIIKTIGKVSIYLRE
ncbi:glycosyltransferase family 39 protein [Methanobrevibacter curvatus]|nr:glycosyltransferase family 39 protein [Methanobrevibacter curvatus]